MQFCSPTLRIRITTARVASQCSERCRGSGPVPRADAAAPDTPPPPAPPPHRSLRRPKEATELLIFENEY